METPDTICNTGSLLWGLKRPEADDEIARPIHKNGSP